MAHKYWITDRDMGAGIPVLGDIKERLDSIFFVAQQGGEHTAQSLVSTGQQKILHCWIDRTATYHTRPV